MNAPIFFRDSIAARAAPLRFRQIGNPYAFLNDVGVEPMLDEVRKGHNLVEIAEVLDVSIGVLLRWIDAEGHVTAFDEAFKFSAEGHLAAAAKAIKGANNDFELKKAKELANHGRFMASKMDRHKYGAEQQKQNTGNVVQFVLHMGQASKGHAPLVIEASDGNSAGHSEIINEDGVFKMLPTSHASELMFKPVQGAVEPTAIGPFEDEPFMPSLDTMPEFLAG